MPLSDAEFLGTSAAPTPTGPRADLVDLAAPTPDMSTPDWKRPDGTQKGLGFLGPLKLPNGKGLATEYTIGVNFGGKDIDIPTLVPTLSRAEVQQVLAAAAAGQPVSDAIAAKATAFAKQRLAAGKSVFADAPPKTVSDAEFFGDDAVARGLAQSRDPWEQAKQTLRDTGERLFKGTAAAADMILGIPGMALGVGADIGARAYAFGAGEDRKTIETAGAAAKEHIPAQVERFLRMKPGGLSAPIQTIIETLGGGKPYDQSSVTSAIDRVSQGVDKATRGYVSAADAKSYLDAAMLAGMARGGDQTAKVLLEKKIKAVQKGEAASAEEPPAEPSEPSKSPGPEAVVVTPKILKDIFAKAKSPEAQVDRLFDMAKRGQLKPIPAPPPPPEPGIGAEAGQVPKTRLAEPVIIGETPPVRISPELESAMGKISRGERPDLSAEERIALQEVAQSSPLVDEAGRPLRSRQGGAADPRLLAMIAATGMGIGGAIYIQKNHPELAMEMRRRIRGALGLPDDSPRQVPERQPEPQPNEDGNYLAEAEKWAPLAAMAGVIKAKGGMWHPEAVERLVGPITKDAIRNIDRLENGMGQELSRHSVAEQQQYHKELAENKRMAAWGPKAVSRYLNRHAGTAEDPLKDVQVPFGEGVKKWGDIVDLAAKSRPARAAFAGNRGTINPVHEDIINRNPEEPIWNVGDSTREPAYTHPEGRNAATQAITSYLSHVGDFLRQNVKPEDLPRYDLVRAVKETAAHDARMEKLAEKASADATAQLPVYKDYGDGMKWVELRMPEKLTAEQAKGVRETTLKNLREQVPPHEWQDAWDLQREELGRDPTVEEMHDALAQDYGAEFHRYTAIDAQGKPIRNSYTGDEATGKTPEEAFLAGRLAEEGNQLGHCVGGYCDAVASGESKIYSLRDAKGKSHVTVEVAPPRTIMPETFYNIAEAEFKARYPKPPLDEETARAIQNQGQGTAAREAARQARAYRQTVIAAWEKEVAESPEYKTYASRAPDDVVQIKGKANRAPAERYLPYVQDFVRGGKWGEVGDLENTGLSDWEDALRGRTPGVRLDAERYHFERMGQRFVTYTEYDAVQKLVDRYEPYPFSSKSDKSTPWKNQRGSVDPKVLAGMAALAGGAALGAYLNPEHPLKGAAYGAVGGALALRIRPREAAAAIRRASEPAKLVTIDELSRQTAYARKVAAREAYKVSHKIITLVPDQARREAIFHALDKGTARGLSPKEVEALNVAREFYAGLGAKGLEGGVIKNILENYATRIYGPQGGRLLKEGPIASGTGLDSPYGKNRRFPTLEEAAAQGYHPLTTDIAQVLEAYSSSVTQALENRNYIRTLREIKSNGQPLIAKEGRAPRDYVFIDHPQLRGFRVHPDIAGDLKFTFDSTDPGMVLRGIEAVNTTQKRMGVMFSFFHPTALEQAAMGASRALRTPGLLVKSMGQALTPAVLGENAMLAQVHKGGIGDYVDRGLKAGLQFGFEHQSPTLPELRGDFYRMWGEVSKWLDDAVPGAGKYTVGKFLAANHLFDRFMWGRLHPILKLNVFADTANQLAKNNARAAAEGRAPLKSQEEIDRMAASFANDSFGGLNWHELVREFNSRWGREIASAAFGPMGRFVQRLAMFAPDWTISTTRAFLKAFGQTGTAALGGAIIGSQLSPEHEKLGGALGALAGLGLARAGGLQRAGGSGVKGLWSPTELADLHRQYILRSAVIYLIAANAYNKMMSGHYIWDNKDPTRIDLGDGRTQQLSKHFMEPFHWLLNPRQQALNKASFIVKEPAAQALDVEYLSTHGAPRMGKTPRGESVKLTTRLEHVAKQFDPIAVQQSYEAGSTSQAAAGFFGAPIYGKTYEERAAAKAERKRQAALKRAAKRLEQRR